MGTAGGKTAVNKQLRASGGIILRIEGIQFHLDPGPGALVKANEYLVEVFGWTDPGTKITINRQEIPVSSQGLFMKNINLTPNRNVVRVEAGNAKGSKEIIRTFVVKD